MLPLILVAGLFQATLAGRLTINGVKPDLVLILVILWTLIYGANSGIFWAFLGGIWLDIFSGGPLGASSLSLMLACMIAGFGQYYFARDNIVIAITAAIVGSLVFALSYLGILQLLTFSNVIEGTFQFGLSVENIVIPSMIYNTTVMVAVIPFLNRLSISSRNQLE